MTDFDILYFGWCANRGHDLMSKKRSVNIYKDSPWGAHIDGGLLGGPYKRDSNPTGEIVEQRKNGWTAIAFWDRSGDRRPGSNTAFLVHAEVTGHELLASARLHWPEVFARPGFPIKEIANG